MQTGRRVLSALRAANLGALRFAGNRPHLAGYLAGINKLYLARTLAPVRPIDVAAFLGADGRPDLFVPLERIRAGSGSVADLAALAALTRAKAPRRVVEIGTFEGLTAAVFARNGGPDTEVFTLDLPPPGGERTARSFEATSIQVAYASGALVGEYGCAPQVTLLKGDSALFDFAPYAGADLFYVDGAHTSDYVARDTLSAFRAVAPDGWVVWHDALVPEVLDVLRLVAADWPVWHLRETNLAVSRGRPGDGFSWHRLESAIR